MTTPLAAAVAVARDEPGAMRSQRWNRPIGDWQSWMKAGGMPKTTRSLRLYQMQRLAQDLANRSPWTLTSDDLAAWLAKHEWARETLRSYRGALRSFYGWAHAGGLTQTDPSRLLRKIPATKARPRPAAERVVNDALAQSDDRVWLMIMLGSRHGLRRGEIARVHTRDVIDNGEGLWSLLVHGKGGKERVLPLLPEIARTLREHPAGWLFPNGKGDHLTPAHVGVLIRRVLPDGITPHQLRHRFASRTYQATNDIRAVQELLGHASVSTTQIYTAVADGALRSVLLTAA